MSIRIGGLALAALAAAMMVRASEVPHAPGRWQENDSPETILSTYHAKKGQEKQLADALARAWQSYRNEKAVFDTPHVLVRGSDAQANVDFTEVFTWVSREIPDHAPASIQAHWSELQSLCEARSGHPAIEIHEVELLAPKQ
jgi:hypothetical protein